MNKTLNKVRKYILKENLLNKKDRVVLGVSGEDSICLFTILNELKDEFNLTLEVVHINHLIREDAKEDASYVEELCKKENIPFHLYEKDVETLSKELHISTEDAGRRVRYEAFNEIAKSDGLIAVAHNSNDKVETFFLNLFRGSGINGLCSIQNKRDNIIRPILCLSRKEIEEYLKEKNIEYKTDSTNNECIYTRNKIRNELIPYVEENIHPAIVSNISNTMSIIEEANEFLNDFTNDFIRKYVVEENKEVRIDLKAFKKQKPIIQKMVLFDVIGRFIPGAKDITRKNIEDILDNTTKGGRKETTLRNNLVCIKTNEYLTFKLENRKKRA